MPRKNQKKVVVTEPEKIEEVTPEPEQNEEVTPEPEPEPEEIKETKTKPKRVNTPAQLEHLKKMREKAVEKKKQNKLEKEKIKDIEKLKTELKLKEYDKLKKKLDEPEPEGPIEEAEKPKVKQQPKQDFSYNDLVDMNVKSMLQNKIKEEKIKHVVNLLSPQTF